MMLTLRIVACVCLVNVLAQASEPRTDITIKFPENTGEGSVLVQAEIDVLPVVVWSVVIDMNRWHTWMPLVDRAQYYAPAAVAKVPSPVKKKEELFKPLLKLGTHSTPAPVGKQRRLAYAYYNLPWPIADQWTVEQYLFDATAAGQHRYRVDYHKVYESQPKKFRGYWIVEPYPGKPGSAQLTYHQYMRTKSGFAGKLFKIATKRTVEKMIRALRKEVKARGG